MSVVADYLQELYMYEKVSYIDEDLSSWLKTIGPRNLIKKLSDAVKTKDAGEVEALLKTLPKVEFKKLYTITSKINSRFEEAFDITKKQLAKKFPKLKGLQLDSFALVVSIMTLTKTDLEASVKKTIDKLYKSFQRIGVKNFGSGGMTGASLLLLAGMLVAAALSTLKMSPLLLALAIVGLALIVFMRGS
jgi:hypothetical protein